ncbi:hypothetical protein HK101_006208 [Irineochytrium annulatum]|nr:hypothetical protein HK101_006208 [Irineochytrium annulatum]
MGSWFTNVLVLIALRIGLGIIPGLSGEAAWTLTNLIYNTATFFMFHWVIGTPFDVNQGEYGGQTLWEQIDNGAQFTPTKKYLTMVPIVLFLLSTHFTHYDSITFMINLTSLVIVLIGKLPSMHNVRILGINKKEFSE